MRVAVWGITAAVLLCASPVGAAEPDEEPSVEELAKADQNPITRFYVLRLEDNAQFGFGPENEVLNFFRIQPLVPLRLSEDWSLLARIVVPIANRYYGLRDFTIADPDGFGVRFASDLPQS